MAGAWRGRYRIVGHMAEILFIKTSSLGDVIHHMPALTDARRALPEARFSWLVEEAFAPLVALHPGVGEVIPVAWRRWRKSLYVPATLAEIAANLRRIKTRRYDAIVDSQGLLRSAIIARVARGRRHGYDMRSIREPVASLFYNARYTVSRGLHAVERNRLLTGFALGYTPSGKPDFGLDRAKLAVPGGRFAVLLHATARAEKEWAEDNWIELGNALRGSGLELVLPWGGEAERTRAERIASRLTGVRVAERRPLDQMARLIAGASFVVGVDTGLLHLAAALSVPLAAIFTGSEPGLTGPVGSGRIVVLGAPGKPPTPAAVARALETMMS